MEVVNKKIMHGAFWTLLARFVDRGIGLVSTLILVRLLTPEDFGVVALAVSVSSFLQLMSDFGFGTVLIQKQDIKKYHYDTVWTLRLFILIITGVVGYLISDSAAVFFGDERVSPIIKCLSALILMRSIQNIAIIDFTKQMRFEILFWAGFGRKVLTFIVTVGIAYYTHSYWALVVGMLVGALVTNIFSHLSHPYRPSLSLKAINEIAGMSGWIFINNIIKYLSGNLPKIMAGRLLGVSSAGYLSVADEAVNVPTTEIVSAINKSTLPGYSLKQNDRVDLKNTYLKVMSFITLSAFPASLGIWAVSEPLVFVALGDEWVVTIPIIQWLALTYLLQSLISNMGSINMAIGLPRLSVGINLSRLLVLVPAIYFLHIESGLVGIAQGMFLANLFSCCIALSVQMIVLKVNAIEYVGILLRPVIASLVMVSLLKFMQSHYLIDRTYFFTLIVMVVVGMLSYLVGVICLWKLMKTPDGVERIVLNITHEYWSNIKGKINP